MLPINPTAETRFLCGKRVYLRPFEKKDLPYLYQWGNDPEIRSLTAEVTPMTPSGLEKFWEKVSNEADRVWFTVCLKDGDRPIGEVGLLRMFPAWRSTDLSIILGDKSAWGQGYGTEAIHLLLDYAFGFLNFHRVALGVVSFNEKALDFYEKVGFTREGIQRDGYFYNHRYYDFIMMSILEDDYRAKVHLQGSL
jgi:diamine N-acetyltransferase